MHNGQVGEGRRDDLRRRHQLSRQDVRHRQRGQQVEITGGVFVAHVDAGHDFIARI